MTHFLPLQFLRGLLVFLTLFSETAFSAQPPNVLLITIDDLNDWNNLLDPDSQLDVPNLKILASRGMLFTKAYCASPACNPSRVATFTGLRPTTSGVYGNKSDWRKALPDRKTLMQRFRDAGYDVRGAGKIFHHHLDGAFHDDASFDDFQPMRTQLYPPDKLNGAPDYGSRNTDWGRWPAKIEDSIDFQSVSYCTEVLKTSSEKPVFLACGIFKPHSPFFAPKRYHEPFLGLELPARHQTDWDDLPPGANDLLQSKKWFWQGMMQLDREQPGSYQDFIQSYAACVTFADSQVGRLLNALDSGPMKDNTIVVLWSDHGFHLGEKDHIEKFALWEKSTHIPFIVSAPNQYIAFAKPGTKCDRPIDMTAIYPTLLEICNLHSDAQCDGQSLGPLLRDPNAIWEKPALMTYLRGNHSVRSDRWRYIRYADHSEELYDHQSDPQEWKNLAADEQYETVIAEHRAWLPNVEVEQVSDFKGKSH